MYSFLAIIASTFLYSLSLIECDPQTLNLIPFDDLNSDPHALCNDGTRGGYYFAKALDPEQSNVFVVHLPGGGQCYDKVSCDSRSANMKSFSYAAPTISVGGFLDASPDRTPLWGANKAYLYYCSSDGYMGDAPASNETWGYHFRGQRLVHSIFKALTLNHGFGDASLVYLTGTSAGARGYMTHIDQVAEERIPHSATVIGLLDAPYYIDVEPYSSASMGFQYQEQQKYKYFNTHGILSRDCTDAFEPSEQWKCQFGEYRMPFVKTPYFLITSQFDSYQLEELTRSSPDQYTPEMVTYATDFGTYDRTSMQNLSSNVAPPLGAVGSTHTQFDYAAIHEVPPYNINEGHHHHPALRALSSPSPSLTAVDTRALPLPPPSAPRLSHRGEHRGGYGFYSTACYYHAIGTSDLFYKTATNDKVILRDAFEAYLAQLPARFQHPDRSLPVDRGHKQHSRGDVGGDAALWKESEGGEGWSMSWIDTCTTFNCCLYCQGIV